MPPRRLQPSPVSEFFPDLPGAQATEEESRGWWTSASAYRAQLFGTLAPAEFVDTVDLLSWYREARSRFVSREQLDAGWRAYCRSATAQRQQPPASFESWTRSWFSYVSPIAQRTKATAAQYANAVLARRDAEQLLAFTPRDFVLFGLPYQQPVTAEADPSGTVVRRRLTTYERRNGSRVFKLIGDAELGLPYGQDRLLVIWLATAFKAAGQPADNVIRFRAASDILRAFDLPPNSGFSFARLRDGLRRLHATTYLANDTADEKRSLMLRRYQLMASADLWFESTSHPNQATLWQNRIQLDPAFAADLRSQAVPVDLNSIRALKANPAALDLYVWQAHRSWRIRAEAAGEVRIRVFGPGGLLEQLGSQVTSVRKARQLVRQWHRDVQTVWPECPNRLTTDGDYLVLRGADAVRDAKLELPGVTPRPPVPLVGRDILGTGIHLVERPAAAG